PASGNVTIDWFLNGTCTGTPALNSGSLGPLVNGQLDATSFAFTVNDPGMRAFRAHYAGDANYQASDGACEPLQVVKASISIAPSATNEVGASHTFTVTLSKDLGNGAGFVPAAGEHVTVSLADANGASSSVQAGSSTCDDPGPNTNAAGQCTLMFTSPTAG